ncbi:MAG: ribonuclease Y [Fimbriimonadaceae bacterium]|nr:ribonuclease Y [Fimbriimonadaceae bacterium]
MASSDELMTPGEAAAAAKRLLLNVVRRAAASAVAEGTTVVVPLPSEDMKGRLIGRDGRNIKAFESVTGADLIIDDSPESVTVSCFDPLRREAARMTLVGLVLDGRIHPGRIEEIHERTLADIEASLVDAGHDAAARAQAGPLPAPVAHVLGQLRFRTSYAQNVLEHSVEVARLASLLAGELGADDAVCRRAGLLHDVGKALGAEWKGPHALAGMEFLRLHGEQDEVLKAVGAHHDEIPCDTPEAVVVATADALSAARPGARREKVEAHIERLATIESLATGLAGVEKAYAVQAGREVRVYVRADQIDDAGAQRVAQQVARRIKAGVEYPGPLRVTVIREFRVTEVVGQ